MMLRMKHIALTVVAAFTVNAGAAAGPQGPGSSQTPYVTPTAAGWSVVSIISVGDAAGNAYRMVGIPDGLGGYDNGNGTFTVLMNHELGSLLGATRAHGARRLRFRVGYQQGRLQGDQRHRSRYEA